MLLASLARGLAVRLAPELPLAAPVAGPLPLLGAVRTSAGAIISAVCRGRRHCALRLSGGLARFGGSPNIADLMYVPANPTTLEESQVVSLLSI